MKDSDLEEHFADFLLIVEHYNNTEKIKNSLTVTTEKLNQEVELLRAFEQKSTHLLQTSSCTSEVEENVTALYIILKEKYNELENKYYHLHQEKVDTEEKFVQEKNEIVESYLNQIKSLENEIYEQKGEFSKKETEFQNEIQVQQASAALNYDEMESRLQVLLRDATQKFHYSNESCNTIREELIRFKVNSCQDIDAANKKIQELEKKLKFAEQQLQLTQEKLFSVSRNEDPLYSNNNPKKEFNQSYSMSTTLHSSNMQNKNPPPQTNIIKNRIVMYNDNPHYLANKTGTIKPNYVCTTTKYNSLSNMEYQDASSEEFDMQNVQCNSKPLKKTKACNSKTFMPVPPPMKQVTSITPNVNKKRNVIRKRKLYDPENLDYLQNLDLQD